MPSRKCLHLPAALALLGAACHTDAARRFDAVDTAPSLPPAIASTRVAATEVKPPQPPAADSGCGRGHGRRKDGDCVQLSVRDAGYVQRVQLPAGRFVMGSVPASFNTSRSRTSPAVRWSGNPPRVTAVNSYWIDLTPVSRQAYRECVDAGSCSPSGCPDGNDGAQQRDLDARIKRRLPQTCVSHEQAATFCRAHQAHLPTEAQWEYAARGPDARTFPWGNEFRDELASALRPVGSRPDTSSYFGILELGTNGEEWVAETYDPDAGLRPFLAETFRSPQGPLAIRRHAFERTLACGEAPAASCRAPSKNATRHVIKSSHAGRRRAARSEAPKFASSTSLEGWNILSHAPLLGFRCVQDPGPADEALTVPREPPSFPLYLETDGWMIFGGVAEATNRREAESFCRLLAVPSTAERVPLRGWRLPSLSDVQTLAEHFRGPGPFWTSRGAATQSDRRELQWAATPAADSDALAARCVRKPE
ncbi:MAG: SUMF1/EgtB/PvdO family nonheme iron enzyme [Nannocystaceae bacterium]